MKKIEKKSKRYREIVKGLDQTKSYKINEAIKLIKERSKVKFIESVDLSINLNLGKDKADQTLRTTVDLPHGNGKKIRVAVICPNEKIEEAKSSNAEKFGSEDLVDEIKNGKLYGRGASDMKTGIAAFVSAIKKWQQTSRSSTKISLIITGDEEADAINGTAKIVEWMKKKNILPDMCIVAEPTSQLEIGDNIRNGRRGSLSGSLIVKGKQGHVAYPHLAQNPTSALIKMLSVVSSKKLDTGNSYFGPTTAEVTGLSTSSNVTNVIPLSATAMFNIRFNTEHSKETLIGQLEQHFIKVASQHNVQFEIEWKSNADPFVTEEGELTELLSQSIKKLTRRVPELSTIGGTSDARFITKLCPVAEFGLVGKTMHQIDENVSIKDIDVLTNIYEDILHRFDAHNEY